MARYEHLPIYKSAMDLAVYMEKQVRNMSRYNKYTIGAEIRKRAITCMSFVVRANSSVNKEPVLEELKQIIQLAKETEALASFGIYKETLEKVTAIMRQNEGWLKSMKRRGC